MLSLLAQAADPDPAGRLAFASWILYLPAIAAIVCLAFGAMKVRNKLPAVVTVLALGGAFVVAVMTYLGWEEVAQRAPVAVPIASWLNFAWGPGEGQRLALGDFALYLDGLSLFWILFVTGLGTLIAIYASEYMEGDVGKGYVRFFGAVSIFLLSMGCLVLGGNLLMLFLGWEGVGLASYLLIGYHHGKPAAVAAAKKAFITNRIGDVGLVLGIWLCWQNFGTLDYASLFTAAGEMAKQPTGAGAEWIPYCLMLGAFGKSAQLPLYVWLPDAMEGPTPVSALIHAATMVTAGVYLIARTYPLFDLHPHALETVAWVGGLTAILAATIGMAQYDMKRVWAYSTISQLGFMFLGLGVGSTFAASFHVFTHAFFKATLFLTAGAVMHGFAGQLDIRKLSGIRNVPGFKVVAYTMLVGCLWLAAIPYSASFFSKDAILLTAFTNEAHAVPALGWLGLVTACLTAYYSFRVWFRVFGGETRYEPGDEVHGHGQDDDGHGHGHDDHGHGHAAHGDFHPHPPRLAMNGVVTLLAIGSILAGLPSYLELAGRHNWVHDMIAASTAASGVGDAHGGHEGHLLLGMDPHRAVGLLSMAVATTGILVALYLHLINRNAADRLRKGMLAFPPTRLLVSGAENKWWVDELYEVILIWPVKALGHVFAFLDRHLVDGFWTHGLGRGPAWMGRVFQPLYNGQLQGYAVTMAGGSVLMAVWILWVWMKGGA
jgi:NADH-quinone oxidoreductase subunit L